MHHKLAGVLLGASGEDEALDEARKLAEATPPDEGGERSTEATKEVAG